MHTHTKRDSASASAQHVVSRRPRRDVHEPRHDTRPAVLTLITSFLATYGWLAYMLWSI